MMRVVTMKTIAAQAGVTQATVSMCLANNARISQRTRMRVLSIADRLGYRPNPYVSALMRIRRQGHGQLDRPVLALVNGLGSASGWRDTAAITVRQMRDGAMERAALRGYRTQEFWLHQDGMSAERFSSMLHARGITGLILGPMSPGEAPPALRWENFAAVRLGVPLPALNITSVCNDHFFSGLQAIRECHARGYRRPGLVILRMHRERFHGRWDGGCEVSPHLLKGIKLAKPLLLEGWDDLAAIGAWLKREKPDVVVSPGQEELYRNLLKLGYRLPHDLGLATLACPEKGHAASGIWQNGHLIGAVAVDTLISMLERNERGLPEQARAIMIEGVWNEGKTLRPVPPP
jgi:DNA-binding LacI/PurR family transcriptional regulator